ncbi:SurA N-terminal domain-containing protein [Thermodesulfobacteriota bacterium]
MRVAHNNSGIRLWFICLMMAIFIVSTGYSTTIGAQDVEIVDRIVAVVNDDIILLSEVNQAIKPYINRIRTSGHPLGQQQKMLFKVRENVLNQLIDQKLTDQEIKRYQIQISEKEIDNTVERIKQTRLVTDEELREALKKEGLTMEEYRKRMKEQILRARLINQEVKAKIIITQEDIEARYKTDEKYGKVKKYHLSHVVMKVPPPKSDSQKLEKKKKMEMVLEQLNSGESFSALAEKYSESSSAANGGYLGIFTLEALSPLLQKTLKGLGKGEFTPVLDTDQGYQIFYVSEIEEAPGKSLEEASPEIETELYNEIVDKEFAAWLEDLRTRSHIEIIQ